jgi:hypothetical protein
MSQKYLVLTFMSELGNKVSFNIKDPKNELKEETIKTAMNTIVEKNIFKTSHGSLTGTVSAQIVTKDAEKFEFEK